MNNIIYLLGFFAGFHGPVSVQDSEACRGAESVYLLKMNGYKADRSQCVLKVIDNEVVPAYWGSYQASSTYSVLGCVSKNDQKSCRGYTIQVPSCKGCVYGIVSEDPTLTANYNAIKEHLKL